MPKIKRKSYPHIGARIMEFRKERDLTQEELAELVNTTQMMISNVEKGLPGRVMLDVLVSLVNKFDVSLSWFVKEDNVGLSKYLTQTAKKGAIEREISQLKGKLENNQLEIVEMIRICEKVSKSNK